MSSVEKAVILSIVETMLKGKRQALSELGIARSTYYRWRQGQPDSGNRKRPWNRITPDEEDRILEVARESPELSSRQLSAWITDKAGFAVSESTVYRILRREGLVKRQEVQLVAGKERLTRDAVRDATRQEINELKRENTDLKHLVADLSLEVYRLKKTAIPLLESRNGANA